MSSIRVSQEVAACPATVWSVLTSTDQWVDVMGSISLVERLDDGDGFGLGTKWRETRTMFGKQATEVMEVTEFEEGIRYVTAAESHGSKYISEMRVDPSGGGSTLSMTFRGEPQRIMAKIVDATVGRLFMGVTRRAVVTDLADIARAAEAESS